MPSEGKKIGEVKVEILEDLEGNRYLRATGEAIFDYLTVWNEQMQQAREEGAKPRDEDDASGDN